MLKKIFAWPIIIATLLLVVPLAASRFSAGWNWSPLDYAFAWVMFAGAGIIYTLVSNSAGSRQYKIAGMIALVAVFLLIWVNGAMGIIGDGDINLLYALVPAIIFLGSIAARFKPRGMSNVLLIAAVVQVIIPIAALVSGTQDFAPGVAQVFVLNGAWVAAFLGSALLFRQAGERKFEAEAAV
jgi:hypothetical protein